VLQDLIKIILFHNFLFSTVLNKTIVVKEMLSGIEGMAPRN
jgi:hypothetical protein